MKTEYFEDRSGIAKVHDEQKWEHLWETEWDYK
jgi:hypothetical protein